MPYIRLHRTLFVLCNHYSKSVVLGPSSAMQVLAIIIWLGAAAAQYQEDIVNLDMFNDQKRYTLKRRYRPLFHLTAPVGWLNEPAALAFFHRQYHVFYQYHPYNGAWGYLHWGHAVSEDLVDWTHYPPALVPKEFYEKHGCLAGSALVHNEYLTLFYTGSIQVKNKTIQNQNVAISSDGILFQKYLYNPIIKESPFAQVGVGAFRNPKVWRYRSSWYMFIGAMSNSQQGQLLLYTSHDMFNWKLNGTVANSVGDMGYMWENPDFFELDGTHVLFLSVRGIQTDGYRFRNLFQTGYIVGKFNYHTRRFEDQFELSTATFNELDYGHDFYAARTLQAHDGRCLLIAWLGMEESTFEEAKDGWASMLTIFRELRMSREGRILMQPIREMLELRVERLEDAWYSPGEAFEAGTRSFELLVNSSNGANEVGVVFDVGGDQMVAIRYSATHGYVSVDRGGVDGIRRADWAPPYDNVYFRIFFDRSSLEIFCGEGDVVFSSRVYPKRNVQIKVGGDTQLHMSQYRLRRSVGYTKRFRKHLHGNEHSINDTTEERKDQTRLMHYLGK